MEVRDSELQEYLSEIYNWYNVKVSIGRLIDILKDLGYPNRKVLPVICRLTVACQRSWTVRSRTQGCLRSKNCAVEPWAGDFSWWIRGQCSFWGTNTWEGAKRSIIPYPVHFQKCTNFRILPAMTMDGYIACQVYSEGVSGDTFNAFVENELLPLCNEFPGPNSIIVMDNASIHRSPVYPTIVID